MSDKNLAVLFKSAVIDSHAYHVPDASGFIKLDAMENPYSLNDEFKQLWFDALNHVEINRYPDAFLKELVTSIRSTFNIPIEAGLVFGNGSDELIQILLIALRSNAKVMSPVPTFVMYQYLSNMLGLRFIGVPLNEDFSLNIPLMLEEINEHQPEIIFLAWPNNPTGIAYPKEELIQIIQASVGLVIIDEAYNAFADDSMLDAIKDYPNAMAMRTLSKLGLAGLRLGFLAGDQSLISELEKVRMPYNIGTLNQLTVSLVCKHIDILYKQTELIRQQRNVMLNQLQQLETVEVWTSNTNFILFRVTDHSANEIHEALLENKILIKNVSMAHPLLKGCLRVTIGTENENKTFVNVLKSILRS